MSLKWFLDFGLVRVGCNVLSCVSLSSMSVLGVTVHVFFFCCSWLSSNLAREDGVFTSGNHFTVRKHSATFKTSGKVRTIAQRVVGGCVVM